MNKEHVLRVPIKPGRRERVLEVLASHRLHQDELDRAHREREVEQVIFFVDTLAGIDFLFMYRRGKDLQKAGAKFMFSQAEADKKWARVLLECTEFDQAKTLPVAWRWPSVEESTS